MSRLLNWLVSLLEPKKVAAAQRKRELEQLCQQCGISKAKAVEIASRHYRKVAK